MSCVTVRSPGEPKLKRGFEELPLREALQKYPEQSFAQKFSLCNRQKLSERKIKEGF